MKQWCALYVFLYSNGISFIVTSQWASTLAGMILSIFSLNIPLGLIEIDEKHSWFSEENIRFDFVLSPGDLYKYMRLRFLYEKKSMISLKSGFHCRKKICTVSIYLFRWQKDPCMINKSASPMEKARKQIVHTRHNLNHLKSKCLVKQEICWSRIEFLW